MDDATQHGKWKRRSPDLERTMNNRLISMLDTSVFPILENKEFPILDNHDVQIVRNQEFPNTG